jgi:dTDP-4-dehydrorhamnose 3,5-epimerase
MVQNKGERMPRSVKEVQTETLLHSLKSEMQRALLWSDIRPTIWAMNSTAPFACDRMSFEQWLQFVFIPKMHDLLINKQPLPTEMAVCPMAQQMLNKDNAHIHKLMLILDQLDRLLSGSVE